MFQVFWTLGWPWLLSLDVTAPSTAWRTLLWPTKAELQSSHRQTDSHSQTLAPGDLREHPNRWHPIALVSPPGLPRQAVCEPPERQLCQGACPEHGSCQRLCRRRQSDLKSQVKREVSLFKYQMPSFILISLGWFNSCNHLGYNSERQIL